MGNCLTEQNNFSRHPNIVVIIKRLSRLALSKFYQFYRVGVETAILLLGCSGVSKQHMSSQLRLCLLCRCTGSLSEDDSNYNGR